MPVNWPCFGVDGLARLAHHRLAMARVGWLFMLAMCGLPDAALGQSWADAYKAEDYGRAAELLQPIVMKQAQTMGADPAPDPAPASHLAVMYARGSGVLRDPILACALARLSEHVKGFVEVSVQNAAEMLAYKASLDESEQFVRAHCDTLTDRQQMAAAVSMSCFAFGLVDDVVVLGEHTLSFDRAGSGGSESAIQVSLQELECPGVILRLRARTIGPPPDAAPGVAARELLELIDWQGPQTIEGQLQYSLTRHFFELRGNELVPVAAVLHSLASWPTLGALAPDLEATFRVEMIRSGHIRWRLDGAPPKRGWIMLPEGDSR
jgi:hypothetical protein